MSEATPATAPLHELSAFQRDMLRLIEMHDQPPGVTLKGAIEAAWNGTDVTRSRVYQNLDILVDRELVEKGHVNKRTNYYQIAAKGRQKLDAHREWLAPGN